MNLQAILILSIFLASLNLYAQNAATGTISLGPVKVGENRLPLSPSDFYIEFQKPAPYLDVSLQKESLQWIRTDSNVLLPRMKIFFVLLNRKFGDYSLRYQEKTFHFQFSQNGSIAQINYSLFQPTLIDIFKNGKLINKMLVRPKALKKQKGLVDYSCSRYDLKITVPADKYYTVGCVENITGPLGNEKVNLEVSYVVPEVTLLDGSLGPFVVNFIDSGKAVNKVRDLRGKEDDIKISLNFNNEFHRLKLALGFGPTYFYSSELADSTDNTLTTPLYLYANYNLTDESSFRFFNAFIYGDSSYFNNAGLYVSYDLAKPFDGRVIVTPLFGAQIVTHKHKSGTSEMQNLFPQGFEIIYKHAFGMKNYTLGFGTFINTSNTDDYSNTWVRFGKNYFYEVNYISWGDNERYSKMWGLSVGVPIGNFF